jgi:hypothetical protein
MLVWSWAVGFRSKFGFSEHNWLLDWSWKAALGGGSFVLLSYQEQGRRHGFEAPWSPGQESNRCTRSQCSNHHMVLVVAHTFPAVVLCSHSYKWSKSLPVLAARKTDILHSNMLHAQLTQEDCHQLFHQSLGACCSSQISDPNSKNLTS